MADVLDPHPQSPLAPKLPPPLVLVSLDFDALPSRSGSLGGSTAKEFQVPCPLTAARRGVNAAANAMFAAAVGSRRATMVWQRHELETKYNVKLVGWPADVEFVSPGYQGSIRKLRCIRAAFERGAIRLKALTPAEVKRCRHCQAAAAHARRALQHSADLKSVTQWRVGLSVKKTVEEAEEIEEAVWAEDE